MSEANFAPFSGAKLPFAVPVWSRASLRPNRIRQAPFRGAPGSAGRRSCCFILTAGQHCRIQQRVRPSCSPWGRVLFVCSSRELSVHDSRCLPAFALGVPQLVWLTTRTVLPADGLAMARDFSRTDYLFSLWLLLLRGAARTSSGLSAAEPFEPFLEQHLRLHPRSTVMVRLGAVMTPFSSASAQEACAFPLLRAGFWFGARQPTGGFRLRSRRVAYGNGA